MSYKSRIFQNIQEGVVKKTPYHFDKIYIHIYTYCPGKKKDTWHPTFNVAPLGAFEFIRQPPFGRAWHLLLAINVFIYRPTPYPKVLGVLE